MLRRGVLPTMSCSLLLHFCLLALCDPPPDPITCSSPANTNCTITNAYGAFPDRTAACRAANVAYPATEAELASAVAAATRDRRKMKAATRSSHSIPKLVCPDGGGALLVSTKYLNRTLDVNSAAMTMTVESGVTLRQLIQGAATAGMALPYAPYWWGLTVGGILGTGAHGSSLWLNGSSVHDYVVSVRVVSPGSSRDGYVKVRTLDENHPDINAAKVSLGVLGIISQVTLRLQPIFKRSITYQTKSDATLADEASSFGKAQEFGDITWYPSQRKAVYRVDHRASADAPVASNAVYDFIGFRSTSSVALAIARASEENHEAANDANGKCIDSKILTGMLSTAAYGLTNNGVIFTGYPVVGDQNRLQSSGTCLDSTVNGRITACPWDPKLKKRQFFHQTAFSIELSRVKDFIEDVQRLVALEPKALCGVELYNGILMRYVKASPAYLGKQEDAIDFDITYYRSEDPLAPRLHEDILEEIEQMGVFKYKGLPHWAKNRNLAFEGAISKYRNAAAFLKVKKAYDPLGLFSNDWTDQVLGLRGDGPSVIKDGCALEGLCVCSQDIHCAPRKGYFCRPGRVYEEARVCTRLNTKTNGRTK